MGKVNDWVKPSLLVKSLCHYRGFSIFAYYSFYDSNEKQECHKNKKESTDSKCNFVF